MIGEKLLPAAGMTGATHRQRSSGFERALHSFLHGMGAVQLEHFADMR